MRGHYSDVWRAVAAAFPDRPAVISRDETVSYAQLTRDAGALAAHLRESGLRAGDAVAILSYNRPEYLTVLFACFATGIAPVPINFRYRPGEVAELLRDSDARMIVVPTSLAAVAGAAIELLDRPPSLLTIDDHDGEPISGATDYATTMHATVPLPPTPPPGGELRLYTGGTTGRPKAVVWGAEDILAVQLYAIYGAIGLPMPESMDDVVRIADDPDTPRVVTLPLAPFMHGTALFNSMNTLALGGTVVVNPSPRLDAAEAVRLIDDFRVTRLIVAGDAVALPLVEAAERAGVRFSSLESVISSGMRFSDDTKRRLHARGNLTVIDMLASTEGGPYAVETTSAATEVPAGLTLLPGAAVLDEQQHEIQDIPGARGILAFRGVLPRGYWRDPEKTAATFVVVDGTRYVLSGDWVQVCGGNRIELLGRGSSVVNTGGEARTARSTWRD